MKPREAREPRQPLPPTTPPPALDPLLSPQPAALDCSDLDALEQSAAAHHEPIPLLVRAIVAVARELRALRAER